MNFTLRTAALAASFIITMLPAAANTARLKPSSNGHYVTDAMINGASIRVLVDTGASTVALSFEDARRAGIRESELKFEVPVNTANGRVEAASVVIRRISVGGITVEDVHGMVLPKGALSGSLLGMSFLSRLDSYEVRQGTLILRY
jgi:aspartyl protease family protein